MASSGNGNSGTPPPQYNSEQKLYPNVDNNVAQNNPSSSNHNQPSAPSHAHLNSPQDYGTYNNNNHHPVNGGQNSQQGNQGALIQSSPAAAAHPNHNQPQNYNNNNQPIVTNNKQQEVKLRKQKLGDQPTIVFCPKCKTNRMTRTVQTSGCCTWLGCSFLSVLCCCMPCCLLPFCCRGCMDIHHECSICGTSIGYYHRI
ncbi:hypothetical protein MP228_007485 [Amoeboaphelidium protococcarum]|nr:hypothetical protein MP228_007485 [Amoeboaphelidium protococcarum]